MFDDVFPLRRSARGSDATATAMAVSRASLVALTAGFAAGRALDLVPSLRAQAVAYLVGMVALNLPHGGYEHFANLRRRTRAFRWRYVAGYLGLVGAFLGLFLVRPVAGLAVGLAVACAKGGGGDVHVMAAVTGDDHLRSRFGRLLAAAARGGAVMAVPVVAWPETFRSFARIMVAMFDPATAAALAPPAETVRLLVGGGYGAVVVAHLGLGLATGGPRRSWLVDAVETLGLVAYFATVPVVVAVGLYFPLWYSARQVAREFAVDATPGEGEDLLGLDAVDDADGVVVRSWGVLLLGALSTGVVVVGVWLAARRPLGGADPLFGAVAFWSVLISVIALPHVVVGSVLDRERGIWHVP
ncbi:MAG: Brp/Blh family beta-carotene 15,15'-dioxygenase [Halolamina sp.]